MTDSSLHPNTNTPFPAQQPAAEVATLLSDKARVVLAAAREVFLANGFSLATTDMIQRAAGVSKSTVYAHYPNKEALFRAVIEVECKRFIEGVRQRKISDQSLKPVLMETAKVFLDSLLSSDILAVYRIVVSEAPRFPDLGALFYAAGPGAMNKFVAETLEQAMEKGELDLGGVGRDAAASLFVNMVRGEAQMQSLTHPEARASVIQREQWVNEAVTTFIRAFQKK